MVEGEWVTSYCWVVIGAGPAGIAAVGKLLDHGVAASQILWIDPQFKVGDFGSYWRNIPSNTKVNLFLKFLHACDAFSYSACDEPFELNHVPGDETCHLRLMAEPLQWVTDKLKAKVHTKMDVVESLAFKNQIWSIKLGMEEVYAKNVILAIGAEPKTLSLASSPVIPLHDAMDDKGIKKHLGPDDTIAVFGSSHSAVLVLKNLVHHSAKKIINFYRSPLLYAVYTRDEILFDDTGLKGSTAVWAREYLSDVLPSNLMRVYSDDKNIQNYLPECTKIVFGVGFQRRVIAIEGVGEVQYCDKTGVIAPGLFGFGIAFPEAKINSLGMIEYRVGLWKFMDYLQRVMPVWLQGST